MGSKIEWGRFISMYTVSIVSKIISIEGVNMIESFSLCGWRSNLLKSSSKEVMQSWTYFIFDSSVMYFSVIFFIFPFLSLINNSSLMISRYMRWKSSRDYPSPRRKGITRYWYFCPSLPSWGLMEKTTAIIISNVYPYWMLVTSLTCDVCGFDDYMVLSLTRWTLSALENALFFLLLWYIYNKCLMGG